jgi:hypothetical protein
MINFRRWLNNNPPTPLSWIIRAETHTTLMLEVSHDHTDRIVQPINLTDETK